VYFDPRAGQFQVQYVDIGSKVTIKPEVRSDAMVSMTIKPTVSTFEGLVNNQYPKTGNTEVSTKVRVKDGDTVVIGGLMKELETMDTSKLPFLGDLPVLGNFFKNKNATNTRQEVIIMISPRILQ
jgi:type IV pilus assembly protein PilQ